MDVNLTPELEKMIQSRIESGRYTSAGEVIHEALRLLEQRDEESGLRNEEIRMQVEEGWEAAKRRELVDGDSVFDRIDADLEAMERSASK